MPTLQELKDYLGIEGVQRHAAPYAAGGGAYADVA